MNEDILAILDDVISGTKDSFDSFDGDLFELSLATCAQLADVLASLEPIEQKEAIKQGLKRVLRLDDRDLIFFREQKVFIRKFKNSHPVSKDVLRRITELASRYDTAERIETQVVNNCLSIYVSEILEDTELHGATLTQEVKDFIRARLRQEIAISEKDAVVFIGDKIIVRRFVENINEENKKIEQRYNGLPKEELEVIRKKFFSDEQNEQIAFRTVMDSVLEGELNFTNISYNFFEKNYIKTIQKYVLQFLQENLDEDEQILLGVGNLALRENWVYAHRCMADNIISLVANKHPNIESFMKSYSGDTTVGEDGIKYKLPDIIDKQGRKWNLPSINSMVLQYKKNLDTIEVRKKNVDVYTEKNREIEEEIKKIEFDAESFAETLEELDGGLAELFDQESAINEELKAARIRIKSAIGDQEKAAIQSEISNNMITLKRVAIKQEDSNSKKKRIEEKKKLFVSKIEKLRHDILKNLKREKEEEAKVDSYIKSSKDLSEKYETMMDALTYALMKKKTVLGG